MVFCRSSVIWRMSRENILLLGGPAAAILQIAHPVVAAGVANHSDFRNDTLGRLGRTLKAVYGITFGTVAEAEAISARIRDVHVRVRGPGYSAFSPDAQMWVLATLIAVAVEVNDRFLPPLSAWQRDDYLDAMRTFGHYFGLDPSAVPFPWAAFEDYYRSALADPQMGASPTSRELARHIAYPQQPVALRAFWPLSGLAAREFLPPEIGARLGLPRTPATSATLRVFAPVVRWVLPLVPPPVRFARQSRRRAS